MPSAEVPSSFARFRGARGRGEAPAGTKHLAVAIAALVGAIISARLAAYQLGWTMPPWEPLFGDGSVRVLRSAFSRALPFPDAGAGMLAYLAEGAAVVWTAGASAARRPLAIYVYAGIAAAMAFGSAALVVLQIAVVHAFCTLCLASALLSFALLVPAATELAALRSSRPHKRRHGIFIPNHRTKES